MILKNITAALFCAACFLLSLNLAAQLPQKAEDVSPLLIGAQIPNITLTTAEGKPITTEGLFKGKRTILLFYRGGWCPYCNLHLSEVGKNEQALLDLGYQIVGVSPDAPSALSESIKEQHISYSLLSDSQARLMKAVGIAFQAPEKYKEILAKGSEGKNTNVIPVPSLFIVDEEGEILFEYINPDYKTRISSELLMAVAESLKETTAEQP